MADFSKLSILGAVRSDRARDFTKWTPREALMDILCRLDAGEISPDTLVVMWTRLLPDGDHDTGWTSAGKDSYARTGLVARVLGHYTSP